MREEDCPVRHSSPLSSATWPSVPPVRTERARRGPGVPCPLGRPPSFFGKAQVPDFRRKTWSFLVTWGWWAQTEFSNRRHRPRPGESSWQLVTILREHVTTFGTAEDGRLFANERGGVVGSSTYYRVLQEARGLALPPAAVASPLAARPYDLRHSALLTCLNPGVDPTEVAERAGTSGEFLLSRYAKKCIDGRQEIANRRIQALLRE